MIKTRLVWILTGLAALIVVVLVALSLSHSFLGSHNLLVKEERLPRDQDVLVKTRAERFGVQKGDTFLYLVKVLYNPDQVSEVDRASLDRNVNLEPFEIRDIKETEFDLDSRTRVYQREYELQLISGEVDHLYEFPTIVVRYKLKDSEGFAEKSVVPEPIYVASRLPADIVNLDLGYGVAYGPLRGVKEEIKDLSQNYLPWILWVLGGFVAALAVADLNLRVIRKRKEMAKPTRKVDNEVLYQAYRSLHGNVAIAVEPNRLLHQMGHILRLVLAQKEKVGWLDEPELDSVSPEIREPAISLFEKCQKSSGAEVIEQKEVEEALRQLEEILSFYFGEVEISVWRS